MTEHARMHTNLYSCRATLERRKEKRRTRVDTDGSVCAPDEGRHSWGTICGHSFQHTRLGLVSDVSRITGFTKSSLPSLMKMHTCSVVSDSETAQTVAYQAPLSMEFPMQEYWSGWSFPLPGVMKIVERSTESRLLESVCLSFTRITSYLINQAYGGLPWQSNG